VASRGGRLRTVDHSGRTAGTSSFATSTFFSVATNLVAGDTNMCLVFQVPGQCAGIFVHVKTSG
jgi:hypothetical protein